MGRNKNSFSREKSTCHGTLDPVALPFQSRSFLSLSSFLPRKIFKLFHFGMLNQDTPHCRGLLVFLRSLPTIHSSHQSLEPMHWFEAIFEMFYSAVFWGHWGQRTINVEFWGCDLKKVRQTSVGQTVPNSDLFDFDIFLFALHIYKSLWRNN